MRGILCLEIFLFPYFDNNIYDVSSRQENLVLPFFFLFCLLYCHCYGVLFCKKINYS